MKKRELILDALQELLYEGTAGTASVQDIASKAGIAKGGLYYYFKSKEEVLDALVERQYNHVIETCRTKLSEIEAPALEKMKLLLYFYRSTAVDRALDAALHEPQNAAIHQKSNAFIMQKLAPIVSEILAQGMEEKTLSVSSRKKLPNYFYLPSFFYLILACSPGLIKRFKEN